MYFLSLIAVFDQSKNFLCWIGSTQGASFKIWGYITLFFQSFYTCSNKETTLFVSNVEIDPGFFLWIIKNKIYILKLPSLQNFPGKGSSFSHSPHLNILKSNQLDVSFFLNHIYLKCLPTQQTSC
jgi:hypothetical protein